MIILFIIYIMTLTFYMKNCIFTLYEIYGVRSKMSKKIVYITAGLLFAINIYAKGLKNKEIKNNQFSLKSSVITKTQEIFNYENNILRAVPVEEEELAEVSGKNVNFIISKLR